MGIYFLLDCGENVFTCIQQGTLLTECHDVTVLITHSHADHIGSLPTLISYMRDVEHKPVTVYFPQKDIVDWMNICGVFREDYQLMQGMNVSFAPGIDCHAFHVEHHPLIPCFGYHIICNSGAFYYSGDARRLPPDILAAFLRREIDELYQDATFLHEQGESHGSLEYLCGVIPLELRSNVYPMHFSDDIFEEIKEQGFGQCFVPL